MKKTLIGIFALICSNFALAGDWIKLDENIYHSSPQLKTYGDSKWMEIYYMENIPDVAEETSKKEGKIISRNTIKYASRVTKFQVWCNDNKVDDVGSLYFEQPLASGNIVGDSMNSPKIKHREVMEIFPHSFGELMFNIACKGNPIRK